MGSNCCRGGDQGSPKDSRSQAQATELIEREIEETRNVDAPSEPQPPSSTLNPREVSEILSVVSITQGETSCVRELSQEEPLYYIASNILWTTGSLSEPIPNGFYFVVPDDRLNVFKSIPTLDELYALSEEGLNVDVIIVDFEKDTKVNRLKQLVIGLVDGFNSNLVKAVKKIAGVVADVFKQAKLQSPTDASIKTDGFPKLGQIKNGSCRVRAILFKVLADSIGLESKLIVGFSSVIEPLEIVESSKHMSIVVMINNVEMLVDLMRSPGRLLPLSIEALYMAHASMTRDDSLELNSPMLGYMNQTNPESPKQPLVGADASSMLSAVENPDDGSRAVRSMGESLKQVDDNLPPIARPDLHKNKGILIPSSEKNETLDQNISQIWNEVVGSQMFENKWIIDFSELKIGTDVGIGSFAKVFRGIWNEKDVAIKLFLQQNNTVENIKDFCNEISILSRLQHPNVIMFIGVCTKPPQLSLITEFMENGSLYYVIHSTGQNLSWKMKLEMLRDICRGLMYIHQMGIVHRDLKSANCLLSNTMTVKICDFGLSRMINDATVKDIEAAGTPQWMAPEVIRNEPFTEKCDIFSFGVIMWELCTLSNPWQGVPKEKVIYTVANEGALLNIPQGPLAEIIADCWSEPEQRPSCEEILSRLETCMDSFP